MEAKDLITSLPTEILGEIFVHCTTSCPDAPLTLSAVCRTFHHAARASPPIWSRLRLSISEEPDIDRGAARKAELWFCMAGACALGVSVEIPKASAILDEHDTLVHARGAQAPLLSAVLHQRRTRIKSLALHAYTERQAHSLLDSIYAPSAATSLADNALALRTLTLFVTSDLLPIEEQRVPAFVPLLSSLTYLKLTTPGPPSLTAANLGNLRTLSIVRPIRSHPLPLESIVDVLNASHVLVRFELETRLDLPLEPSPSPAPSAPPSPTGLYHTDLITIPALTHLSLRTNNNPVLLSRLVVPALHTLHLNALDGKRPGRAEETATALRRLLTRMDLPDNLPATTNNNFPSNNSSSVNGGERGVQVLELAGVSIYRGPHGKNESWEWCFRHMRHLRHISARNMDAEHLVELLAQGMGRASVPGYRAPHPHLDPTRHLNSNHNPSLNHNHNHTHGGEAPPDNAVCPRLERLAVPAPEASIAMRAFRVARPYVKVAALGFSGGAVYGWDNEDALKPRPSARALVAPPPPSGVGQGFGGFGGFGSRFGRPATQAAKPVKEEAGPSAPASPPVVVGGFGFGSSFSRMRQTQSVFPSVPQPDFKALRRDGVNW